MVDALNLGGKNMEEDSSYVPLFFRLSLSDDKNALKKLFSQYPDIQVYDKIIGQIEELVKARNPKITFTKELFSQYVGEYINDTPLEELGVWVYYSWSRRLVHVLDEQEFVEVRTNRNKYKILPEELDELRKKKIGVIGLSIGQSIAVTMAIERVCGELRLADFDLLELSNYNRVRTGLHNLGISKVVVVAREIAEIDPFLKVSCFNDGITEDNVVDFLQGNGKLDLVVEVCDGLNVKILARLKAKELQIPLVMDTSDRGMIDIERYDLEPSREILHGLISHLNLKDVKNLKTNEEKVPFLLPMVGVDTISLRSKASMVEVGQTISTWPQLASAVALGGGITTDVCRRILLNQLKTSGRFYMDVEEIISDQKAKGEEREFKLNASITNEEMVSLATAFYKSPEDGEIELTDEQVRILVDAATRAPSGANSQSWKFLYYRKRLFLFLDILYTAGLLDYENTTSYVGIGTATENLVIMAHSIGLEVITDTPDLRPETKLIVSFKFFKKGTTDLSVKFESHECDDLAPVIPFRITNRNVGVREKIDEDKLQSLVSIARSIPGADLKLITGEHELDSVGEIIAKTDRLRVMDPGGHQDFLAEIRWTQEEAEYWKNGIDLLGTVELSPLELAGLRIARHKEVVDMLRNWKGGSALEKLGRKLIKGASAVGLLVMPEYSSKAFYSGGRAMERVWLTANKMGLSVHPVTISTLMFNRMLHGGVDGIHPQTLKELKEVRKDFENLFNIGSRNIGEIMLFRLVVAGQPKRRSLRYPLDSVLSIIRESNDKN